jgi:hypothetical protein
VANRQQTAIQPCPYVRLHVNDSTLLHQASACRTRLLADLSNAETADGWKEPSAESAQTLWTSVEVLYTLVESGIYPKNYRSIIQRLRREQINVNGLIGWEYEGIPKHISTFVTGDVARLFFAIREYDDLEEILLTLQSLQNVDGGWGLCDGDAKSKVRSTSWALRMLLRSLGTGPTDSFVSTEAVARGVRWLQDAQRDNDTDSGWSNLPDHLPSNTTATALAVDALLEALCRQQQSRSSALPLRTSSVRRGVNQLVRDCADDGWRGTREEFGLTIGDSVLGRHVTAGTGTTVVAQVLMKACDAQVIPFDSPAIYHAIMTLVSRCKPYVLDGAHRYLVVPSDDDGTPVIWNSAFAVDAFSSFQEFYLKHLADRSIDRSSHALLARSTAKWRYATAFFVFVLTSLIVLPHLGGLGQASSWFSRLSALIQGLILAVAGIVMTAVTNVGANLLRSRLGVVKTLLRHSGEGGR